MEAHRLIDALKAMAESLVGDIVRLRIFRIDRKYAKSSRPESYLGHLGRGRDGRRR